MFFTFAVYSIIFAIGTEVDSFSPSSSLSPSTITSTSPLTSNYVTLSSSPTTESTVKSSPIKTTFNYPSSSSGISSGSPSTAYSKPNTLTIDLRSTSDLFSRPDDSNYRSPSIRPDLDRGSSQVSGQAFHPL